MATKAERFRADEARRPKKSTPTPEVPPRKAKPSERARPDASALHAAENEKSSPARRAEDARTKTIRVRGKARG